ncbi:amidohydrolase [Acidisoma cellulosilytica]|uniref:Amidohydrolase n=1 Tax=Acidisoma cellulosilyticum TaxID=2802395 RepID=A0A963Z2B3_9PROT|nr:amidohydrolase [Acidisoma cellulosilyticum]MCB8881548.1 amidohydrolase [Acidisoma cellulosilyticum]
MTTQIDTILFNARLRDATAPAGIRDGDAIAISGGLIAAVGTGDDILKLRNSRTEVFDLGGAYLTPGLVDGHAHPVSGNDLQVGVDMTGARTAEEMLARLRAEAQRTPLGQWVMGYSLDPIAFAGLPHVADAIEDAVGGRPTCVFIFDYHGVAVSRTALTMAGVTGPRSFVGASVIVCDADGRPTGVLLEPEAIALVKGLIPVPTFADRVASLRTTLNRMAASGLTGIHVMDANTRSMELFAALEAEADLPLRLHVAPWVNPGASQSDIDEVLAQQSLHGKYWRVVAAKFFIDGTIDGGTGWLHEPDIHGEGLAALWPDHEAYQYALRFFAERQVQTITHAIGDHAIRFVLDTLKDVPEALRRAARHRIEHIETLPDEDIGRFAAEGIIPSMQPSHAVRYTRADHSDNWSSRLGKERADRAWRCRDIADAGAPIVMGSDWPIAPFDPREILVCARFRRLAEQSLAEAIQPSQALTGLEALAGLTSIAAYAVHEEAISGALTPGMRADLTALSVDPINAPADALAAATVPLTMMDGRVTHNGL